MSGQRLTAAQRRDAERVASNAAFLAAMTDEELANVESDFYTEGDDVLAAQIIDERARRGVTR